MWKRIAAAVLALLLLGQARPYSRELAPIGREGKLMAKITDWSGAVDGDWEESGNWTNGVPAAGDTVHVLPTATSDMDTNLDRSADDPGAAGLDLALFDVHEDSTINIGSSGSPLQLVADKFIHRGRGLLYLKADDAGGTLTLDRLIIDSNEGAVITQGTADITAVEFLRGVNSLTNNATISSVTIAIGPRGGVLPDISMNGTGDITTLYMSGGELAYSASGAIFFLHMSAGLFSYTSPGADLKGGAQWGGTFEFRGPGSISSTYWLGGGTWDTTLTSGLKVVADLRVSPQANEISTDETLTATLRTDIGE